MIVTKFGGTSMANAIQFQKIKSIIDENPERRVVVVSAPGKRMKDDVKITDLLYTLYMHLQYGVPYDDIWKMIEDRYFSIQNDLQLKTGVTEDLKQIKSELSKNINKNYLISRGEFLAAKLMSEFLGFAFVDSKDLIRFSYDGSVDQEATRELMKVLQNDFGRYVVPGFYGSYANGEICLFSRGGSDITGSYLTSCLGASIYENWTDVPGVLTADPRIVTDPKTVPSITYAELRELSYMGANVLHEESVAPVEHRNIRINIRNTNEPELQGTFIQDNCDGGTVITGIAGTENFVSFDICKANMSQEIGFVRKVLEIFENFKINIEHMPTGVDTLSVIVSGSSVSNCMYEIISRIEKQLHADVSVRKEIALIAVVGRNMAGKSGVCAKIFESIAAANVNVKMIAQSADESNIIVGLDNKDFKRAIRQLYSAFSVIGWI